MVSTLIPELASLPGLSKETYLNPKFHGSEEYIPENWRNNYNDSLRSNLMKSVTNLEVQLDLAKQIYKLYGKNVPVYNGYVDSILKNPYLRKPVIDELKSQREKLRKKFPEKLISDGAIRYEKNYEKLHNNSNECPDPAVSQDVAVDNHPAKKDRFPLAFTLDDKEDDYWNLDEPQTGSAMKEEEHQE